MGIQTNNIITLLFIMMATGASRKKFEIIETLGQIDKMNEDKSVSLEIVYKRDDRK